MSGSLIGENLGWKGPKQLWEKVRGQKKGKMRQISYNKSPWGFKPSFLQSYKGGVDQKSLNIQMIFSEVFYGSTAVAMTSDFASDTGKNWWSCTQPVLAEWLMDNSQQSWPCPSSVTCGIACGPIN